MANYASKVIEIALAEVGYCEKSKAAWQSYGVNILYDKTKGAGSDNYTKYGYEMHKIYPSVMDFPAYWCDAFVDWCFYKAYGIANAKRLLGGNFDDYTKGSIQLYKNKKSFYLRKETDPRYGDQIFFSKNDTFDGVYHTALVYKTDATRVYTVEGNTNNGTAVVANGGSVCLKSYLKTDTHIYGYGRPAYDPEANVKVTEVKVESDSLGLKIVGTTSLNVRASYSTNSNIITTLAAGTKVQVTKKVDINGTKWFYIPEKKGWISGKYVEGWLKEANGRSWYVMVGYTYPAGIVKTINGRNYVFDKAGWLVTSDRINTQGVLTD